MEFNKCPVCGEGVVLEFPDGTFACDNEHCKSYEETDTTTYDLLIQCLKDLYVTRQALEELWRATHYDTNGYLGRTISQALEKTEHKDK